MTDKVISPLRQRLIDDMTIRRFGPQDTAPLYPPRQKLCGFPWPVSRQGHRGGRPSAPAVAGVDRSNGTDRQRRGQCPAVLLQGHAEAQRSCQRGLCRPASLAASRWTLKEEAIEWVKRCPDPFPGGEYKIEIRQVFEASDFETMTPELREQEERLRATARGEGRALRWGALDVGLRAPKSPGTSRTRRSVLSALGTDRR